MARPRKSALKLSMATINARARVQARANLASKAYVKKQITKHDELTQSTVSIATTTKGGYDDPHIVQLNPTGQFFFKSGIDIRLKWPNTTASRIIVFQYLQSNESAPTLAEIISVTGASDATTPYNGYDFDNRSSYKILHDQLFSTTNSNDKTFQRILIPLRRLQRKTVVTSDDSATSNKGSVYVLMYAASLSASTGDISGKAVVLTSPKT